MNRPPGARDPWWTQHQATCGGTHTKVKEPPGFAEKSAKKKAKEAQKAAAKRASMENFFPKISDQEFLVKEFDESSLARPPLSRSEDQQKGQAGKKPKRKPKAKGNSTIDQFLVTIDDDGDQTSVPQPRQDKQEPMSPSRLVDGQGTTVEIDRQARPTPAWEDFAGFYTPPPRHDMLDVPAQTRLSAIDLTLSDDETSNSADTQRGIRDPDAVDVIEID